MKTLTIKYFSFILRGAWTIFTDIKHLPACKLLITFQAENKKGKRIVCVYVNKVLHLAKLFHAGVRQGGGILIWCQSHIKCSRCRVHFTAGKQAGSTSILVKEAEICLQTGAAWKLESQECWENQFSLINCLEAKMKHLILARVQAMLQSAEELSPLNSEPKLKGCFTPKIKEDRFSSCLQCCLYI